MSFELGGNNGYIVLGDADPEIASAAGAWSAFYHAGQMCVGAGRHIVVRAVAEEYTQRLAERARSLKVGDPRDTDIDVGPIVSERQRSRIMDLLEGSRAMGAAVLAGGASEAPYVEPTVLGEVTAQMPVWQHEVFGPVAPVMVVDSDEEAIAVKLYEQPFEYDFRLVRRRKSWRTVMLVESIANALLPTSSPRRRCRRSAGDWPELPVW